MNNEQLEFLKQYMDDYQIKKFIFLIENDEFNTIFDFLDKKNESYENIELVKNESYELLEILDNYKPLEETNEFKNIQDDIVQKNKLLNSFFDFANEEISEIKSSYEKKIKENNKNLFISEESVDFYKKNKEASSKLTNHLKRHLFAINSLYVILGTLILYKTMI